MTVRTMLAMETITTEDRALVRVDGEIDLSTAAQLRDLLVDLSERGINSVDIDLSGVQFMDSTGIAVLVAALRRCKHGGGQLLLLEPSASVTRLLHATRLSRVFQIGA
jgi:anti-sigma B factor antagonist